MKNLDHTIDLVLEFHEMFEMPWRETPGFNTTPMDASTLGAIASDMEWLARSIHLHLEKNPPSDQVLRAQLMVEELGELIRAMADGDSLECLDALCDMRYVNDGTALALGLGSFFIPALDEIHRSNMAKAVDGEVERDKAGRILKPEGWTRPDLKTILEEAGDESSE